MAKRNRLRYFICFRSSWIIMAYEYDLVILVPGKDDREAIDGLLKYRCGSMGISIERYYFIVHPRRDPGVLKEAHEILRPFINTAQYALVIFDHEGSGQETVDRIEIANRLEKNLERNGWEDRNKVIVIEPELENWIWSNSFHVDEVLGWTGNVPPLRKWLEDKGYWPEHEEKPRNPKEAYRQALKEVQIHPSSALFGQLAQFVSLERCTDPSFNELKEILSNWFSTENPNL